MAREKTRLQFGKYNGDEHWGYELEVLGKNTHGLWLGGRKGTKLSRPGLTYDAHAAFVVLIPDDEWWVATFNAAPAGKDRNIEVYVDITTPTTVNQGEAFTLDLDLDVIHRSSGLIELVDEDEFAEHAAAMSYPPRLVSAARESADGILAKMQAGEAPFDGSHKTWLAKI